MKAAARSRRDRIRAQLADLKMPGALEAIDDVLTGVDGGGVTASEAIEQLLGAQITLRNNRRLQAAMRSSRLPGIKTLDDFDALAISLACRGSERAQIYYGALADLITSLEEAKTTGARLKILTYPFLVMTRSVPAGQNRRHDLLIERASRADLRFEEWGRSWATRSSALIDLPHCHIVNIRGSSYRMRKHTDLSKILHSPPAVEPSPPKRKRARAEKTTN